VRIDAESEEELEGIRISRPDGRSLVDLEARNGAQHDLAGLVVELRESDLESLYEAYAEGIYDIRASTAGGSLAFGSAKLSFDLPAAPRILHPAPGALVRGTHLKVHWQADREAVGYEVQVEQGENDGLRVRLPAGTSSFLVPDGFLARESETSLEVAAIGANGNRTLSEVIFTTAP
jgi:hypothetical protein